MKVPYIEALLSIKAMVRHAITQYKTLESKAHSIEVQDLLQKDQPAKSDENKSAENSANLVDVNMLLAALVGIED